MMKDLRRLIPAAAVCLAIAASPTAFAQKDDKKSGKDDDAPRPKLALKAQPMISTSPARVVLLAELTGGANDYQEYYCPSIEWEWGDGTQSGSSVDCQPYEAGKSEIKRRYTVEHVFRAGNHHVSFRLKRNSRVLAVAGVNLQVQAGLSDR